VSGSSDVIEVPPSDGPDPGPIQTYEPPEPTASDVELILAGIIGKSHGPIIRQEDEYDGAGDENAAAVANAHVYRLLTNRSHFQLELHLKKCPKVRRSLRLNRVLHHTSFARSWREQFPSGTKSYLKHEYCDYIREELDRITYGDEPEAAMDPYFEPPEPPEPLPEIPHGEIDTAIDHVRDIMLGTTGFDRGPNTTYETGDLLDVALDAARNRVEFNAVIEENGHDPALKTVMNAIKNKDPGDWQESFEAINARLLKAAKRAGMLDRPLESYADTTIIPFYPQKKNRPKEARGGEKKRGTVHGFHFGSLVVRDRESGKDFVVAIVPYTPEMKPLGLLKQMVEQAEEHCTLKSIRMDSAFSGVRCINYIRSKDIELTTRLKRRGEIKSVLAMMSGEYDDFDGYEMQTADKKDSTTVRVVAEPDWNHGSKEDLQREIDVSQHLLHEYGESPTESLPDHKDLPKALWKCRRPYATTNEEVSPEHVVHRYKQRWRVENSYADKKRALLGKTQSRHHSVRVFLFWLTGILYNGWMLTRTFLRMDYPNHAPRDRPPVTLRLFIKKVLQLEYG
jgi:hypothetical protein